MALSLSAKVMYCSFEYVSPSVVRSLDDLQYVSPDTQPNIPIQYRVFNKDSGQLFDLRANDPAELSYRCFNKDVQKFFDIRDGSPWPINTSKEPVQLKSTDTFLKIREAKEMFETPSALRTVIENKSPTGVELFDEFEAELSTTLHETVIKILIQSGGCLVQKVKTILETTTMLVVAAANGEEQFKNICVCGDKTTQNLKARATMKYDDFINSLSELVSIVAMVTSILFIKAVSDVVFFHGGPGPPLLINFSVQLLPQKFIPSAYYSLILSVRNTGYSSLMALEEPFSLSNSGFRYVAEPPYCRRLSDLKYCDFFLFFFYSLLS